MSHVEGTTLEKGLSVLQTGKLNLRVHIIVTVLTLKELVLSDEPLEISLDEIRIDDKLYFVVEPMEVMDYKVKWLKQSCIPINQASMSILVNVSPAKEFSMERGVRQGDPLSHFLFILATKGLNAIVSKAVEKGIFRGIKVGRNNVVVSHLQYADGAIFFGEWNKEKAKALMCIL
ncbi:hypothetical protein Tco_0851804, partial [Tanacetum coccineum]